MKNYRGCRPFRAALVMTIAVSLGQSAWAQQTRDEFGRLRGEAMGDVTAREIAPVDLTGTWISIVTEDWSWRMTTPPPGNYASIPISDAGRAVADEWSYETSDPNSCLAYGAPGLIREPMRIRLSWDDDNTLRFETDNGMQTRLFHFDPGAVAGGERSLQGDSVAEWHLSGLKVVTTNLAAGWLRKNGVPYSEDIDMTEYVDRYTGFEHDWITVTTILDDPVYLSEPWILSTDFRRLPDDDDSWNPRPCYTSAPLVESGEPSEGFD